MDMALVAATAAATTTATQHKIFFKLTVHSVCALRAVRTVGALNASYPFPVTSNEKYYFKLDDMLANKCETVSFATG